MYKEAHSDPSPSPFGSIRDDHASRAHDYASAIHFPLPVMGEWNFCFYVDFPFAHCCES